MSLGSGVKPPTTFLGPLFLAKAKLLHNFNLVAPLAPDSDDFKENIFLLHGQM